LELDQHIQGLNHQIDKLLKKHKTSNMKHSENITKINTLQGIISTLEHVSSGLKNCLIYLSKNTFFFIINILKY